MNSANQKKILVLVEGEKADVIVMQKLFAMYPELDAKYKIISYCTNIYTLYQDFFPDGIAQHSLDLLQVLKSREKDLAQKYIFDDKYTDILLIFDLDPQDPLFTRDKIRQMQAYFCESSDMGKLYLNYPMIEAFYHMTNIPDAEYISRTVGMEELKGKTYKSRVNCESKGRNYRKFIANRDDCNTVILQNIGKARYLLEEAIEPSPIWIELNYLELLERQLDFLQSDYLYVLCTCVMYVYDYNSQLLFHN